LQRATLSGTTAHYEENDDDDVEVVAHTGCVQ
jgi:hypothetical protein